MYTIETNLAVLATRAKEKEAENDAFGFFLKGNNLKEDVDGLVQQLEASVSSQIDCTACGNCCKSLMINVTEEEADRVSHHLQIERAEFDQKYLEKGSSLMVINTIPCHFLEGSVCTIYEQRFAGCREFPALHLPDFKKRLFTVFAHYARCPIIYNVVEQLKVSTGFFS